MPAPKDPIKYAAFIENLRVSHTGHKDSEETKLKKSTAHACEKNYAYRKDLDAVVLCPICQTP